MSATSFLRSVRNDQADDEDREDVEEQDSPEDLSDGLGNVLLGMLGFASGDADELGSLEGEAHHHGDADQGGKAAHEGRVADRPVLEARRRVAREDSEDHREARADEEDHGYDLEEREPVFRLAEAFYGYVVEREYEREEKCAPECSGHVGEPPAHDELGGHKVDCDRNGPVVAVVPAEGEAEAFVDVAAAVGGERAGHGFVGGEFAEARHQEVDHEADDRVGEQGAAGTGLGDRRAGRHEKSRADGAADGDHRDVTRLEVSAQSGVGAGGSVGHVGRNLRKEMRSQEGGHGANLQRPAGPCGLAADVRANFSGCGPAGRTVEKRPNGQRQLLRRGSAGVRRMFSASPMAAACPRRHFGRLPFRAASSDTSSAVY